MTAACLHCGSPIEGEEAGQFCCKGCETAFAFLKGQGLDQYYRRRSLDPSQPPMKPDQTQDCDFTAYAVETDGVASLNLMVEGLQCAACVWLIETILSRQPGVIAARLNMTTRRLALRWNGALNDANALLAPVLAVGYRLQPFDPSCLAAATDRQEKELLRAMAVTGFAAANVMLFSVSIWAGAAGSMDWATRSLFHWISALIALPAVLYGIRPFARSAFSAMAAGRVNMDVPVAVAVVLAAGLSLFETMRGGAHAYFDASAALLFFLLIGRYLDSRARGKARRSAEHLLALKARAVTVEGDDGVRHSLPPERVRPGDRILVAAGERIGVDGIIADGRSEVDAGLITGESLPVAVGPGDKLFAGTINMASPLRIDASAVGENTLLAEIVRMMETAEQGRARHVAIADRVSRLYAPVVHILGLATFLFWLLSGLAPWQDAMLYGISVLIITCPCALALAVPVVQIVASGRLLQQGILLKSATALERLAEIDRVVFDKTGTLTEGRPVLEAGSWNEAELKLAASLAAASHHPLARAITRAAPGIPAANGVREEQGSGLVQDALRLGSRRWLGIGDKPSGRIGPELWLKRPDAPPVRFTFSDRPRADAARVVETLRRQGLGIELLSGDRAQSVAPLAAQLGIDDWRAGCTPGDKCRRLQEMAAEGRKVLMVGDGLNDAPALAAAHVSVSPSTAADISQTAADIVFQGDRLGPVLEALDVARRADRLVRQNFGLAFGYNIVMVPLAMAGFVTPLVAALAMSSSSILVIVNALRLSARRMA